MLDALTVDDCGRCRGCRGPCGSEVRFEPAHVLGAIHNRTSRHMKDVDPTSNPLSIHDAITMASSQHRRRQPRFRVTRWTRFKVWLFQPSRLRIRGSITRLRHTNKRPVLTPLRLCLPTRSLSWKLPVPDPVPPINLINDPWLS